MLPILTRRRFGLASGSLFAWALQPRLSSGAGRDPRFLVVFLRGGVDGLGVVAPIGDPDWAALRGDRGLSLNDPNPGIRLDSMFAINSAMPHFARFFLRSADADCARIGDALSRALALRTRKDVLESGMPRAGVRESVG